MLKPLIEAIEQFCKVAKALPKIKKVFGPYDRKNTPTDTRQSIILVFEDGSKRTMPYPRYLMEQHLGRKLDENETVDHIDRNNRNNDISNLQLLPRSDHSALDTRRVKLEDFNCADCGKPFQRSPRLIRDKAKKGRSGPFCSKSCAARHARKVQTGKAERAPLQQHMPSTYYRNKKLQEHANKMAAKYANDIAKLG
jgi:hypothetical protein